MCNNMSISTVLQPLYENRFKVEFLKNEKQLELLTVMVVEATTSIHEKIKAYLTIEPCLQMGPKLNTLYNNPPFDMKMLGLSEDGNTNTAIVETFTNCKITSLNWRKDYLSSATMKVYLTLEAEKYTIE